MSLRKYTNLSTGFLQRLQRWLRVFNILITFSLITACSSTSYQAPVSSRTQPPSTKVVQHRVARGETLYSIAWRYGLDYRGVAKVNNIDGNFSIFPGQIILLDDKPKATIKSSGASARRSSSTAIKRKTYRQASKKNTNNESKDVIERKHQNNNKTSTRSEKEAITAGSSSVFYSPKQKIFWRWPSSGKVITNFYSKTDLKKGIDIAGKKGESVLAAASGKVVYAGSGLRGYGKLVIIKHSDEFLSAYAHNHRLRVKEGDIVKTGQRIADIGTTGTGTNSRPKLHFQIRRDGKPVDPIPLLPKK